MRMLLMTCLGAVVLSCLVEAAEPLQDTELPDGIAVENGRYISKIDGMPMVLVPAGEFIMGSGEGHDDEQPAHRVYLDRFLIDIHEVTNAQFERFVQRSGYQPQGPWRRGDGPEKGQHPVRFVTWYDADAYARWAGKQLPTEAQWEKAARGTRGYVYPWGNEWLPDMSRRAGTDAPMPVGSFPAEASPYGCLDMA